MTDPANPAECEPPPPPEAVTAWHPMLVTLLEIYLPAGWQLIAELLLSRLPQRIDMVILELVGTTPGVPKTLPSIFNYLRPHTLIEHKGPTDDIAGEDALVLLGYAAQYMRLKKLKDPADLCLMVICDHITPGFVKQVTRLQGHFDSVGNGLWRGELLGATLHGVETEEVSRNSPSDRLLYAFSRAFLTDPRGVLPLDEESRKVYALLQNQVEQFRKVRGETAMKDYELAQISLEELLRPIVKRFTPEQLARTFTPEEIAKAFTPEEIAKAFTPEQIARAFTPEQLVKAFTPEQIAKTLEALPPDVWEQLKKRLH
jgi:hypothetical protein